MGGKDIFCNLKDPGSMESAWGYQICTSKGCNCVIEAPTILCVLHAMHMKKEQGFHCVVGSDIFIFLSPTP